MRACAASVRNHGNVYQEILYYLQNSPPLGPQSRCAGAHQHDAPPRSTEIALHYTPTSLRTSLRSAVWDRRATAAACANKLYLLKFKPVGIDANLILRYVSLIRMFWCCRCCGSRAACETFKEILDDVIHGHSMLMSNLVVQRLLFGVDAAVEAVFELADQPSLLAHTPVHMDSCLWCGKRRRSLDVAIFVARCVDKTLAIGIIIIGV